MIKKMIDKMINVGYVNNMSRMIPITEARRNLGELVDRLAIEGEVYLLRGGKIAAKLSLPEEVVRKRRKVILKRVLGAWKGTDLDSDLLWNEILVKERKRDTKKIPPLL